MTIKNYEANYQVFKDGTVLSTPTDGKPSKVLKQEIIRRNHTNYRRVSLSKYGKVTRFAVHRLVAEAFISNPDNKPQVNHIDSNGENNNVENLEWVTGSENMKHSAEKGRQQLKERGAKGNRTRSLQADAIKESLIGQTFGNRILLEILTKEKHPKALFRCLFCDREFTATLWTVVVYSKQGKFLACRSCSLKHSYERKKNETK